MEQGAETFALCLDVAPQFTPTRRVSVTFVHYEFQPYLDWPQIAAADNSGHPADDPRPLPLIHFGSVTIDAGDPHAPWCWR